MKAICAMCILCVFSGCAKRVVYKEVYMPISCDVEMPKKPTLTGDLITDFANALKHSEILEKDLQFCVSKDNK